MDETTSVPFFPQEAGAVTRPLFGFKDKWTSRPLASAHVNDVSTQPLTDHVAGNLKKHEATSRHAGVDGQ